MLLLAQPQFGLIFAKSLSTMTDPGPILGDTSSQDAAVSELESFSIFDQFLPLFKGFTFQTRDFQGN